MRREFLFRERIFHSDHGAADDVGGGALQTRVDRGAFVERADGGVGGLDLGIMTFAAEQRLDVPMHAAKVARRVHISADARKAFEIFADVGARFLARNPELVRQSERRNAVDDPEIDRLGAPPDFRRHSLDGDAEHFRSRHGVDVEPLAERALERRDIGDLGEQPQLDLRIVG